VVVIGAGMGGLSAAALLAARGLDVTLLEAADHVGGKARRLAVDGRLVEAGPTVFTLKSVFEALFDHCGADFDSAVATRPLERIAHHRWPGGASLDLVADPDVNAGLIGRFAGAADAAGYRAFAAEARHIWTTLADSYVHRPQTNPIGLTWRLGLKRLADLQATRPYETLWSVLAGHFRDPRLVQLFGRYATYCGCSPFRAPATLMLIAHVEAMGVWQVDGGLQAVAEGLATLARRHGARIRTGAAVEAIETGGGRVTGVRLVGGERLPATAIIANCDPAALADGRFGPAAARACRTVRPSARSLSALTWMLVAEAEGLPAAHHTVVFSNDYAREFADLEAGRPPLAPSVYLCAQDRGDGGAVPAGPERFQLIVNAPARADTHPLTQEDLARCETAMLTSLRSGGLSLRWKPGQRVLVTPTDYANLFPSTGGALYGRASHGPLGAFLRPGSRSWIPGLYLAGGGTHPGAGVPMAAISGRLAADALMADLARSRSSTAAPKAPASISRSAPAAMPGGMSMPSPTAAATASPSSPSSARSSRPIM
jgi:1-hydroxycarotenoid 3,4-desaturase